MKLTFNIAPDVLGAVRELADKRGTTMTEVIRQAIGTLKFLDDAVRAGGHVLVLMPDGAMREVLFR